MLSEGANSTGLTPTAPRRHLRRTSRFWVNLTAGMSCALTLPHDGATLVLAISNTVTGAFCASWPININHHRFQPRLRKLYRRHQAAILLPRALLTWKYMSRGAADAVTYSTSNLTAVSSGPTFSLFIRDSLTEVARYSTPPWEIPSHLDGERGTTGHLRYCLHHRKPRREELRRWRLTVATGPVIDQYAPANTYSRFDLGNFNFAAAKLLV
jgi:hypothetical protein